MKQAVILNQKDILEAVKSHFANNSLEIDLPDGKIIEKIGYLCRSNEAIPIDSDVFPINDLKEQSDDKN